MSGDKRAEVCVVCAVIAEYIESGHMGPVGEQFDGLIAEEREMRSIVLAAVKPDYPHLNDSACCSDQIYLVSEPERVGSGNGFWKKDLARGGRRSPLDDVQSDSDGFFWRNPGAGLERSADRRNRCVGAVQNGDGLLDERFDVVDSR